MKKIIFILFLTCVAPVFAENETIIANTNTAAVIQTMSPAVAQNIVFENCTKIFAVNQEKLFYLTLASLSANHFNIEEMQSINGYIIFSANRNKYLATVAKIDDKNSILKVTPCNNIYNFPPGIITNTFKYIDLNLAAKI